MVVGNRTSLSIPKKSAWIWEKAQLLADEKGVSLSAVATEALEAHLGEPEISDLVVLVRWRERDARYDHGNSHTAHHESGYEIQFRGRWLVAPDLTVTWHKPKSGAVGEPCNPTDLFARVAIARTASNKIAAYTYDLVIPNDHPSYQTGEPCDVGINPAGGWLELYSTLADARQDTRSGQSGKPFERNEYKHREAVRRAAAAGPEIQDI